MFNRRRKRRHQPNHPKLHQGSNQSTTLRKEPRRSRARRSQPRSKNPPLILHLTLPLTSQSRSLPPSDQEHPRMCPHNRRDPTRPRRSPRSWRACTPSTGSSWPNSSRSGGRPTCSPSRPGFRSSSARGPSGTRGRRARCASGRTSGAGSVSVPSPHPRARRRRSVRRPTRSRPR